MIKKFKIFENLKNLFKNNVLVLDVTGSFSSYIKDIIEKIDLNLKENFDCYFGVGYWEFSIEKNINLEYLKKILNKYITISRGGDPLQACVDNINNNYSNKKIIILTDGWIEVKLNFKNNKDNKFAVLYTDDKPKYDIKIYRSLDLDNYSYTIDFLYDIEDEAFEIYKMLNDTKKFNI